MNLDKIISLSKRHAPRWLVLCIDLGICVISFYLANVLRLNFQFGRSALILATKLVPLLLAVRFVTFYYAKTYKGIVRFTGTQDALRIFVALVIGSAFMTLANLFNYMISGRVMIPSSIIIIDFVLTLLIMTASRLAFKMVYQQIRSENPKRYHVVLYGAGESGIITKRTLDQDSKINYRILAFLDDDPEKTGKRIDGVPIYPGTDLLKILKSNKVNELVLSIQNINQDRKREIIETCLAHDIKVKNVPPIDQWINGELNYRQIKKVNIEELLGRDTIQLDKSKVHRDLTGKTILITGAAGSIGSEIARQVMGFHPGKVILLDQAETPLYELEKEMLDRIKHNKEAVSTFEIFVGDVKNEAKMRKLFERERPQIIYHAAAYKHVPLMEQNPEAAVVTNVFGTKVVADLAVKYQAEKFVMVSTDKAVNPTNVMGASKRIAEIYVQALNETNGKSHTKFITTRFGNVLGSNGSVIPLFRKQIDEGGPITITHPDITRYFMTIPEACQLVLEAGSMGQGGEIYIFDMGKPVRIVDLAKNMIKLSGLTLGKDIHIKYVGLRPGEKIQEELLNDRENTTPTHHPKITIARISPLNYEAVVTDIDVLLNLLNEGQPTEIVRKMKAIVPEYRSNNSVYEALDKSEVS